MECQQPVDWKSAWSQHESRVAVTQFMGSQNTLAGVCVYVRVWHAKRNWINFNSDE